MAPLAKRAGLNPATCTAWRDSCEADNPPLQKIRSSVGASPESPVIIIWARHAAPLRNNSYLCPDLHPSLQSSTMYIKPITHRRPDRHRADRLPAGKDPLRGKPCTHAGALAATGQVRLVAAADPDPERLAQFGRDWDVDRLYRSHRELLEKERVDLLAVASPTDTHCEIVLDAAESGKVRGIYCEKPIALTLAEADRMISACEKAGVALVIGHERRFGAHFVKAREFIREGGLGEIRTVLAAGAFERAAGDTALSMPAAGRCSMTGPT